MQKNLHREEEDGREEEDHLMIKLLQSSKAHFYYCYNSLSICSTPGAKIDHERA